MVFCTFDRAEPAPPQLDGVRDACEASLRASLAPFEGRVHGALRARLGGMRDAFLSYLAHAFATMQSAEVGGMLCAAWHMLSEIKAKTRGIHPDAGWPVREDDAVYVAGRAFAAMDEMDQFFAAAGITARRVPPPQSPFHDLPDHLQAAVLERVAAVDAMAALRHARFVVHRTRDFGMHGHVFNYHCYRFLTKRLASRLGAGELDVRAGEEVAEKGMLRFFAEGVISNRDTPCAWFVRFHAALCGKPTREASLRFVVTCTPGHPPT